MSSSGTCRVYIRVVDSSVCPKTKAWSTSFQVRFLSDDYSIHSICWYSIHWNSSSAFAAFNFQICKHSFDKSNKKFVIFLPFSSFLRLSSDGFHGVFPVYQLPHRWVLWVICHSVTDSDQINTNHVRIFVLIFTLFQEIYHCFRHWIMGP